MFKSFLPECYLDTNLVEALLNTTNAVNHKKGNSNILRVLKTERKDSFAVALIDDDKRKPKDLHEFVKAGRFNFAGLKLFWHSERKHFLIQLSPAIEQWLLNECAKAEIKPSDYRLPDHLKGFKNIKGIAQRNDVRFSMLFKDMLQNEKCNEIRELKRWLHYFKDNHYNSNIEEL